MINHYNAVTLNVTGNGQLTLTLFSRKGVDSRELRPIILENTDKSITRLANFNKERVTLEIRSTEFGALFRLNSITIFHKPVATSHPQI